MRRLVMVLSGLVLAFSPAALAQPAFPGAEGFGAETRGGRGGRVIAVTTLADDGPGSLRAAVEAEGPRTIVFRVVGTIQLASDLKIEEPFLTIAGQSAPGQGVTLRDHPLIVQADEVIIRYLRVRLGDESQTESDAISLARGRNIILDHVSASWSVDETLSVSQRSRDGVPALDLVTVQWSIIAESLNNSVHGKGEHGYGSLVRGSYGARYSFHHNLWAHHRARMPRPGNYENAATDPTGPSMEFVNNVFYNWGGAYAGYNADDDAVARYDFIGNSYISGANSADNVFAFREESTGARAYFAGNAINGVAPDDPWAVVRMDVENPDYRQEHALTALGRFSRMADAALHDVLYGAGASNGRDSVDERVVQDVRERAGVIIDSQADVGGWPILVGGEAYPDADGDGINDAWEQAHDLDPSDASDGALDRDGDGYTNIEEFLDVLTREEIVILR